MLATSLTLLEQMVNEVMHTPAMLTAQFMSFVALAVDTAVNGGNVFADVAIAGVGTTSFLLCTSAGGRLTTSEGAVTDR